MALSKLSGDEQGIIFSQLCNVLDPGVAVALSSVSNELRTATQGLLPQRLRRRQQLVADAAQGHGHARVEHVAQLAEDDALLVTAQLRQRHRARGWGTRTGHAMFYLDYMYSVKTAWHDSEVYPRENCIAPVLLV